MDAKTLVSPLLVAVFLTAAPSVAPACVPDPKLAPCLRAAPECSARLTHEGLWVEYYRSYPLDSPQPHVKRAVVVIHGGNRTSNRYFEAIVASAEASCALNEALIVAPRFPIAEDKPVSGQLFFDHDGDWKQGALSSTTAATRVSSFEVVDELVRRLADRSRFPNLAAIVVAGHSSGGQFTQRYAASNPLDGTLPAVLFHYVVANPSSYMYLNAQRVRPRGEGFWVPEGLPEGCAYNQYKHGLERRDEYLARLDEATLIARYRQRRVTYLLGTADVDPQHSGLDRSCAGLQQGPNRYERGLRFKKHLDRFFSPHAHTLLPVAGVGHEGERMFASQEGRVALFP